MLKVLFLTRYGRLGASSRYRFMQYEDVLNAHGVQCNFHPLLDDRYLRNRYDGGRTGVTTFGMSALRRILLILGARKYDVVVLEGEALPYLPAILESYLALIRVPFVVDFDDAIFHYYDRNPRLFIRLMLGGKIRSVVRRSACVVAGNDYLADYARRAGAKHIELVPTVIDLERYPVVPDIAKHGFNVGWIGSPGSSRYLSLVAPALNELGQDSQVRLTLVGAGSDFRVDGIATEQLPWSEDSEVERMRQFDVGIMPVPDDPWARGKCGLKLIQYMACGLPVIASPVGVNTEIVEHGINGFLASTTQEWIDAFAALRTDRCLARRMGESGRTKVEKAYAVQVTGPQLANILKRAARNSCAE